MHRRDGAPDSGKHGGRRARRLIGISSRTSRCTTGRRSRTTWASRRCSSTIGKAACASRRDATLDDPFELWKQGRRDRFDHLKPVFFAISGAVFLWMAWALRRTKSLWIAAGLSIPLVISLTNLTCYYYCMFLITVPLMPAMPTSLRPS